jgi:serine/threonine protein kinase
MEPRVERLRVGPYKLVRQLETAPGQGSRLSAAQRWLSLNEDSQTAHLAYRFKLASLDVAAFFPAAEAGKALLHPHLLPIEYLETGPAGSAWVFSPFTGNHDGLVSLRTLLSDKGGRLNPVEAERAMNQLLEAVEYAHAVGFQHGDIGLDEILVDRRGSLAVELYGLRRRLRGNAGPPASEVCKDEVRSIIQLGYQLVTGLSADEPRITASRLIPRLDKRWDEWFNEGLDPYAGFPTAGEALAALPGNRREVEERERIGPVRVVIERFRAALRAT